MKWTTLVGHIVKWIALVIIMFNVSRCSALKYKYQYKQALTPCTIKE